MQAKVKIATASKLVCLSGDAETLVSESTCYPYILLPAIDFIIANSKPFLQKLVIYVPTFSASRYSIILAHNFTQIDHIDQVT